ncbi:hypothetical protein C8Q75DRAFT_714967 [Abortiporus biennis]|nr:hypothetical protein C8Q75DRAFT_714967 [Abortiporus biennis]
MSAIHPAECQECAETCEETPCAIKLTPQCTDQCVVVACNDDHEDVVSCPIASLEGPCADVVCTDGSDCAVFDDIFQCCSDYHHLSFDGRQLIDQNTNPLSYEWDPSNFDHIFYDSHAFPHSAHTATYPAGNSMLVGNDQGNVANNATPASFMSTPAHLLDAPGGYDHNFNQASFTPSSATSTSLKCMWGDCKATFNNMAELVGHVNLQHLRLPSTSVDQNNAPVSQSTQFLPTPNNYASIADTLSCLWGNCHLYPTPNSIPGPSTGDHVTNTIGVLANHLMQDHLGISTPSPTSPSPSLPSIPHHDDVSISQPTVWEPQPRPPSFISPPESAKSSTVSISMPPTPCPEHDCSAPSAHTCHWTGCGATYASCDALTEHINVTHVGSGKAHYDCYWEGCLRHGENGFSSKQKICRHLQSHTGHRPFQCKVCQQNFSEAATLAQHMRRHTQEKPYVCDFPGCGKSFAITGALTIHKRTHNGHKPFKCTFCDRAFSESSNLSKHLRTHTGARPYPCTHPGCVKSFARPDQLARHMGVHQRKKVNEMKVEDISPATSTAIAKEVSVQ